MLSLIAAVALTCGTERWDVKTLSDPLAHTVQPNPVSSTIEELITLKFPAHWLPSLPRLPEETNSYIVLGRVVGYKLESDLDFHIVIAGKTGKTMVVEIPDPTCMPASLKHEAETARQSFLSLVKVPPRAKYRVLHAPLYIMVSGPAFFDKLHGQTGVAPNGIEIHPVRNLLEVRSDGGVLAMLRTRRGGGTP